MSNLDQYYTDKLHHFLKETDLQQRLAASRTFNICPKCKEITEGGKETDVPLKEVWNYTVTTNVCECVKS